MISPKKRESIEMINENLDKNILKFVPPSNINTVSKIPTRNANIITEKSSEINRYKKLQTESGGAYNALQSSNSQSKWVAPLSTKNQGSADLARDMKVKLSSDNMILTSIDSSIYRLPVQTEQSKTIPKQLKYKNKVL